MIFFCIFREDKLFIGMKTYHILKNGVPVEISIEELNMLNENNEEIGSR